MKPGSKTLMMLLRRGAFARCVPLAVVYLLGASAAAPPAPNQAPDAAAAPPQGRRAFPPGVLTNPNDRPTCAS